MIRVLLDSDNPGVFPAGAQVVATYSDLAPPALRDRLNAAHDTVIWIDRGRGDPLHLATVIDVEDHLYAPGDAPSWYDRRRQPARATSPSTAPGTACLGSTPRWATVPSSGG